MFDGELTQENFGEYYNPETQPPFFSDEVLSFDKLQAKRLEGSALLGLDYYSFTPVLINLFTAHCIAIYGDNKFGKSNLLSPLLH